MKATAGEPKSKGLGAILLNRLTSLQHLDGGEGQGLHFILAGKDEKWPEEAHPALYLLYDPPAPCQPTGQHNRIDPAADHRRERANLFGHLVAHRLDHLEIFPSIPMSDGLTEMCLNLLFDQLDVIGAEIGYNSALPG